MTMTTTAAGWSSRMPPTTFSAARPTCSGGGRSIRSVSPSRLPDAPPSDTATSDELGTKPSRAGVATIRSPGSERTTVAGGSDVFMTRAWPRRPGFSPASPVRLWTDAALGTTRPSVEEAVGVQPGLRVDVDAVLHHADVQVRPGGLAPVAGLGDHLPRGDALSHLHERPVDVAVDGDRAVAVLHPHPHAEAAGRAGADDGARHR